MLLMVIMLMKCWSRGPEVRWIWKALEKKLSPCHPISFSRLALTAISSLPPYSAPWRIPPETLPSASPV